MTEAEYLQIMIKNCEMSTQLEQEAISNAEARISLIAGYQQAFQNRLKEITKQVSSKA